MRSSVTNKVLRVLVLGATGVFGSRLAERLAREEGIALVLAARNRDRLEALADRLGVVAESRTIDRTQISPADLADVDVVVDAAGPFQQSHPHVIEAALAACVHYVDLADGRAFVAAISGYNARARAAGVAVVSGASSIPALSHAVIDTLVEGWSGIDAIRVGIFPGNRAPRGLAVVEAILSYAGRPVRVFRDGRWCEVPGWGLTQRWRVGGAGARWASVCDTPDQDLLVARYNPTRSAEFFAGVELTIMHIGLLLLSLPVRWGLVGSLRPLARLLHRVATWLRPFGSDRGAMLVEVSGSGGVARWTLDASGNRGPYVPVLACVALLRRWRDVPPSAGAGPCVSMLTLADFAADFADLGIVQRSAGHALHVPTA
jgi:Saccharopine dehydrogenase NADP binding domain